MKTKMLTFFQYADMRQREMAKEYGLSIAEIRKAYPRNCSQFRHEWWDENVVKNFDKNNADMNMHVWRSLDERQRYQILRTNRALGDKALTRRLVLAVAN